MQRINMLSNNPLAVARRLMWSHLMYRFKRVNQNTVVEPYGRYIAQSSSLIMFTIPAEFPEGAAFKIVNNGEGEFEIKQSAGQLIYHGGMASDTGVGHGLTTFDGGASIEIVCTAENTEFMTINKEGDFQFV